MIFDKNEKEFNKSEIGHQVTPVKPLPWWYEHYKRIRLFPWWTRYNIGIAKEASYKDKILKLAKNMDFDIKATSRIIRHAVSEFSKYGLGSDYPGYHTINHNLEVAYISLLSAGNQKLENKMSKKDIKNLFVAALFHDFDPRKEFEKPNEDNIELFIRNDRKLAGLIDSFEIDLNIVIALIHRTTYPFIGTQKEHALKRIHELLSLTGINNDDVSTRRHYEKLGLYLSICDRIAGYCLGDFNYAKELARRNARGIGWHSQVINEKSVEYFTALKLKDDKDTFERVIQSLPVVLSKNFFDNVEGFREAWEKELEIKASLRKNELNFVTVVENIMNDGNKMNEHMFDTIMRIRQEYCSFTNIHDREFGKSLYDPSTILITLRINSKEGEIVGYVKGGPLEKHEPKRGRYDESVGKMDRIHMESLRRGTYDENIGKRNSVFMEWIAIETGYMGEKGGHMLRSEFLKEARRRNYAYVTSYYQRELIIHRKSKGEPIEIVQQYDAAMIDYYRIDLSRLIESIPIN
ncbi:MAG TPA: HD domain-containing protein [Nitrososphaeraceae archaeon]|jgi:hypothetical protein